MTLFYILLGLLALALLLWDPVWSRLGAPQMAPWTLRKALRSGRKLLLVDVRTPLEYRSFHIKDAMNIPVSEPGAMQRMRDLAAEHPDHELVVICMTGHRSPPPTRALSKQGIRTWNLTLGMLGWKLTGGKTTSGE